MDSSERRKKVKKICFAISVHEKREVVIDLLENIRYFCPNSSIVLYNGGRDAELCNGLGYPVCPTSKPLIWGNLVWFFLYVMEWLEGMNYDYDYLITIDSDALFAKKGYEEFINAEMEGYDYMAAHFRVADPNWYPGQTMNREWSTWQPVFNTKYFKGCFNPAQVFSKKYVQKIVGFNRLNQLKQNLNNNKVFALDEILFATLSETLGMKSKSYPVNVQEWNRFRPYFTKEEVKDGVENHKDCYLIHPVCRDMNDKARIYLREFILKNNPQ